MILLCNYMNLYKTEFSALCDEGILDKMLIKCNDKYYRENPQCICLTLKRDSSLILFVPLCGSVSRIKEP